MSLDATAAEHANRMWDDIVPVLHDYIAMPNVSAAFDPEWREHGFMQAAVDLIRAWCEKRPIAGATVEVHELPGRSPVILIEVPPFGNGAADDTDSCCQPCWLTGA